jgi:hypothetical protein
VFRDQKLLFPRRPRRGSDKGELLWGALTHNRVLQVLHNPRYAGAFSFGRFRLRRFPDGRKYNQPLPRDQWYAILPDAHPGYITWEQYEQNLKRLRENAMAHGHDRRKSPPREGCALLQGIVVCGLCGNRMTLRYHSRQGKQSPTYVCQRGRIEYSDRVCQHIPGGGIDEAVGELLLETVTPTAIEVAIAVQQEIQKRIEEVDEMHRQTVQRAEYEAQVARRRFMKVDPDNRLVADALEADWNEKLRAHRDAQEEYEKQCKQNRATLTKKQRAQIAELATDFPALWRNPQTSNRERKRVVRLLVEDVTLIKKDKTITAHVRFKGGAATTLSLPVPLNAWDRRRTPKQLVAKIDHLLNKYTDGQIVAILNEQGVLSGDGRKFNRPIVRIIRQKYGLKSRYQRLREVGLLTKHEMAELLGVPWQSVKIWQRNGLLLAVPYNDKNECLFPHPGPNPPVKQQGIKLAERRKHTKVTTHTINEVQYEA